MKRFLINLIFVFSFGLSGVYAQCGATLTPEALKDMGSSQYIKDFAVDSKTTVTFKVILNSKNHYKFNMVNASSSGDVVMELFDGDRLLVSNLDDGKMYKAAEFVCRTTKAYNLTFSFKDGKAGCAAAVLSLVKQYNEGEMGF